LAEDLAEAAQKKVDDEVRFSPEAVQELDRLCQHAYNTYSLALRALQNRDRALAQRVCRLEDEFDHLYLDARQGHIERLESGICQPEADVIFAETLRNLERISDHADNLGISVMRT
jgi:phosphate:Na+ symporter